MREQARALPVPELDRTEALLAQLLVHPDSLTDTELRELAKGVSRPLQRRKHAAAAAASASHA